MHVYILLRTPEKPPSHFPSISARKCLHNIFTSPRERQIFTRQPKRHLFFTSPLSIWLFPFFLFFFFFLTKTNRRRLTTTTTTTTKTPTTMKKTYFIRRLYIMRVTLIAWIATVTSDSRVRTYLPTRDKCTYQP